MYLRGKSVTSRFITHIIATRCMHFCCFCMSMTADTPGQCSFRAPIMVGNEARASVLFASGGAFGGAPSPTWEERLVQQRWAVVAPSGLQICFNPLYLLLKSSTAQYLQTEAAGAQPRKTLTGLARTFELDLQSWALCA